MSRLTPIAAALALAFSGTLPAAETVTRSQVLGAIRTFDACACGCLAVPAAADKNDAVAKASNTILKFSLESDDVIVDLGPDSVTWCDVKKGVSAMPYSSERSLLLAAYLSGCVKAQLQTGRQDPNPLPGWVAMLRVYRAIKIREAVTLPEVEGLLARQMDGTLGSYAVAAVARSTERLRKAYGGPAGPARQLVAASQP